MESAKNNFQKLFFLAGERIGIITVIAIAAILLLTNTAMKAYSESEEKPYRQESIAVNGSVETSPAINPDPVGVNDHAISTPIGMSYEVDKVTPTPTPAFDPNDGKVWLQLAECESHQNWQDDTGNGYYGGLQFSLGAWASVGGSGKPSDASSSEQIMRGKILQERRGWGPWGACSSRLGLR